MLDMDVLDGRKLSAGKWMADAPVVGHLADERSINYPDTYICHAPAVTNAVGNHLVRGDDDVSNPRVRQPCIAPRERRCFVSARVSMPWMPGMFHFLR